MVLAQVVADLPRVTTACETKIGGLLMGIGDGFSSLKSCPGGSRKVVLGEVVTSTGGEGGVVPTTGTIAFIGQSKVLKNDGSVWYFHEDYETDPPILEWREDAFMRIVGVDIKTILQWNEKFFVTTNGSVYKMDIDGWKLIGSP